MRGGVEYQFAEYRNFSTCKGTRSSHKESDNNGTSPSSSDNETTPKYNNSFKHNINVNFLCHKCVEVGIYIFFETFLIFGCRLIIRRRRRISIVITFFMRWSCPSACTKILILCKWILFSAFMNKSSQIKNSEDNLDIWHPKTHGLWNYLQSFSFGCSYS